MRRIYFDSKGRVRHHEPFWKPWGCMGCLWRVLLFLLLFFIFMFLLSQFRSCSRGNEHNPYNGSDNTEQVLPDMSDDDEIIDRGPGRIVGNRINVLFQAEVGAQRIEEWKTKFKELYPGDEYEILFCDINTKLMSIRVPSDQRQNLIDRLPSQIPDIPFFVFEEEVMTPNYRPSDPIIAADSAYYLQSINAYGAWDYSRGDRLITIAVVDSYFDLNHPEFARATVVQPYNTLSGTSSVTPPDDNNSIEAAHGTMVAGVALGAMDNSVGAAGIAPQCAFMPISTSGNPTTLAMLQGILYAVNHGAQVINLSMGMEVLPLVHDLSVEQQIELARTELLSQEAVWKYVYDMCQKYHITIVSAAGNQDVFTAIDASKRGQNTIKVSATDASGHKARFSNFGNFEPQRVEESTVSAPGVHIYGNLPSSAEGTYVDGTSFAAPIVSGIVALMKSLDYSLSTPEIIDILKRTGKPAGSTIGPQVDAEAALKAVVDNFMPFDSIVSAIRSRRSIDMPTSLLRPSAVVEDSTALAALWGLNLSFDGNQGKVQYYCPSTNQVCEANATFEYNPSDNSVIVNQPELAVDGSASYGPAKFTIKPGINGKAEITEALTDSFRYHYKIFIKKNSR